MDFFDDFYQNMTQCLAGVKAQKGKIAEAARIMGEAEKSGHNLYSMGTGHSHLVAQDVYARAGGYAKIYPITEIEMTLLTDPIKSTYVERESDYANVIENLYPLEAGDVLIAISNSGRNPFVVEYVQRMKKKGVKIIVITSLKHTAEVTSRHPSGKKLCDLGDVVLDNCAPYNDATTPITSDKVMGPVSTATGIFIIHSLVGAMVAQLTDEGADAPVFISSNGDNADEYNKALFDKYVYRR